LKRAIAWACVIAGVLMTGHAVTTVVPVPLLAPAGLGIMFSGLIWLDGDRKRRQRQRGR
jgi:hypothetical protein